MAAPQPQTLLFLFLFLQMMIITSTTQYYSYADDPQLLLQIIRPSLEGGSGRTGGLISCNHISSLSTWNLSSPLCSWKGIQWLKQDGTLLNCNYSSPLITTTLSSSYYYDHSNDHFYVQSIHLPSSDLKGHLPKELASLNYLQNLYLNDNGLNGVVPLEIGNSLSLKVLSLSNNNLNGTLPTSLWNLCDKLNILQLNNNSFSGSIPADSSDDQVHHDHILCPYLTKLDLSSNQLYGPIPNFIPTSQNLHFLDLHNNSLSGSVPETLTTLKNLTFLDLSFNNLTGSMPINSRSQDDDQSYYWNFNGNPLLRSDCASSTSYRKLKFGARVIMINAVLICFMVSIGCCIVFLIVYFHGCCKLNGYKDQYSDENFNASCCSTDHEEYLLEEDGSDLIRFIGGENLSVEGLLNASGVVIGKTNYATLYKAIMITAVDVIPSSSADKQASNFTSSTTTTTLVLRLLQENTIRKPEILFLSAIKVLGNLLHHENLVALRGCYQGERGEKLLVYDHVEGNNLEELLINIISRPMKYSNTSSNQILRSWVRRYVILLGVAHGLAFMHNLQYDFGDGSVEIFHGNLKSRNVMVGKYYGVKLMDYGLCGLMNPVAISMMIGAAGSEGYGSPDMVKARKVVDGRKNDVYSFGILLLEVLMGRRTTNGSGSGSGSGVIDLPGVVKRAVLEDRIMEDCFDDQVLVLGDEDEGVLMEFLKLGMRCCATLPSLRPDMREVVKRLEELKPAGGWCRSVGGRSDSEGQLFV